MHPFRLSPLVIAALALTGALWLGSPHLRHPEGVRHPDGVGALAALSAVATRTSADIAAASDDPFGVPEVAPDDGAAL